MLMTIYKYSKIAGIDYDTIRLRAVKNNLFPFIVSSQLNNKCIKWIITCPTFLHHVLMPKEGGNYRKRKIIDGKLFYYCFKCNQFKLRNCFFKAGFTKSGIRSACKKCDQARPYLKEYNKQYKQRDYVKKRQRDYKRKIRKEEYAMLSDSYIKRQLARKCGISEKYITETQVAEYRRKAELRQRKGFVYFIAAGTEAIKIGYTKNGDINRLESFQVGIHLKLRLLKKICGGMKKEKELHRMFSKFRIRGEWFKYCPEILDYIKKEEQIEFWD